MEDIATLHLDILANEEGYELATLEMPGCFVALHLSSVRRTQGYASLPRDSRASPAGILQGRPGGRVAALEIGRMLRCVGSLVGAAHQGYAFHIPKGDRTHPHTIPCLFEASRDDRTITKS